MSMHHFLLDQTPPALWILASTSLENCIRWPVATFDACGEPSIDTHRLAVAVTCLHALSTAMGGPDPLGTTYRVVCRLAARYAWDDTGVILRLAQYLDERGLVADLQAFLAALGAREDARQGE